ncbi:MAG TPA: response regulator [Thermomicrobiales bacterium]|nr:response regulator [Thermomicrobiales bacterium]
MLVVTDDDSLAGFLNEGLPLGGFWASWIASGLQALEVFRLRQFDLVLIDAGLRSFDALELMRRLRGTSSRSSDRTPRTKAPFVVVSEEPEPITHDEAATLGVAAVMSAPIELEEIVQRLHEVFAAWRQDNPDTPLADSIANLSA